MTLTKLLWKWTVFRARTGAGETAYNPNKRNNNKHSTNKKYFSINQNDIWLKVSQISNRRGFEGVFMGVCSSVDVAQSEGDLPDFNQSEH